MTKLSLLGYSFFHKLVVVVWSSQIRIFVLTLLFYLSLYFSINNRTLLAFSLIYFFFVYRFLKSFKNALFLVFLATLPFAKGQGYQITLLPKEQISRYALFKISYFFPVYLSSFYLALFYWLYLREKILEQGTIRITASVKTLLIVFFVFIGLIALSARGSAYPGVILLSTIQLVEMALIFFMPFVLKLKKKFDYYSLYWVVAAGVFFQSLWVVLQRLHNGPLGKDIEVFLPGLNLGIRSAENPEILRSTGTFFEPSILGTFLLLQIAILFLVLMRGAFRDKLSKKLIVAVIVAGLVTLVFTGSRGIYFLTILAVVTLLVFFKKNWWMLRERFRLKWFIVSFLIFLAVTPYLFLRLPSLTDLLSGYGSGTYRIQMMAYAARLTQAGLFGVGINLSPYYFATAFAQENFIFDPTYPHNLFFQLLAEVGVIGLSLFGFWLYLIFKPVIKNAAVLKRNEFAAAAVVFLLCAQIYPIFLNQSEILSFFFLYAGLAVYRQERQIL